MKAAPDFASRFKEEFLDYVDFMVGNGRSFRVETTILKAFDRYLSAEGCESVSEEVATRFVFGVADLTDAQYQKRHRVVRMFLQHCSLRGSGEPIPPLPSARSHGRYVPHLYTNEQIATAMKAAGEMTPQNSLRPHTYQTIIGLLFCTGMRVSEVLNLDCVDVDLDTGILCVRNTKFRKSRLIPLHSTATTVLKKYLEWRVQFFPAISCGAIFLNNSGRRLTYPTFNTSFLQIVRKTGIRAEEGRGARVHDLRHTFAVNRLAAWYDEGVDIHELLPVLSTYMGHAHFEDTVYYLNVSAELMAKGSKPFQFGGDLDE